MKFQVNIDLEKLVGVIENRQEEASLMKNVDVVTISIQDSFDAVKSFVEWRSQMHKLYQEGAASGIKKSANNALGEAKVPHGQLQPKISVRKTNDLGAGNRKTSVQMQRKQQLLGQKTSNKGNLDPSISKPQYSFG